jgi:Transposase IS4
VGDTAQEIVDEETPAKRPRTRASRGQEDPQPGPSGIGQQDPQPGPSGIGQADPQPGPSGRGQQDPQPGPSGIGQVDPQPGPSGRGQRAAKRRIAQDYEQAEDGEDEDEEDEDAGVQEKLARIHSRDRHWVKKKPATFGNCVPDFQPQQLKTLPANCTTPLDFYKVFVDDEFIQQIADCSVEYARRKNFPDIADKLTVGNIRTSHAVMYLTGYLTPSSRKMLWEIREDTGNSFVKKAISRSTFRNVIRFTYFTNGVEDKKDSFWKVRPLFKQLNKTAKLYVTPTEFVCVDEAMAKYFGPHPLKQFLRGKPTRFGYKIWVLATAGGQLLSCEPYAGSKTLLPDYGLGMGPNVVYGLVEKFGLEPGSKVVCDNLFTSIDLLDHMSKKQIGLLGTLRVNR